MILLIYMDEQLPNGGSEAGDIPKGLYTPLPNAIQSPAFLN